MSTWIYLSETSLKHTRRFVHVTWTFSMVEWFGHMTWGSRDRSWSSMGGILWLWSWLRVRDLLWMCRAVYDPRSPTHPQEIPCLQLRPRPWDPLHPTPTPLTWPSGDVTKALYHWKSPRDMDETSGMFQPCFWEIYLFLHLFSCCYFTGKNTGLFTRFIPWVFPDMKQVPWYIFICRWYQ